MAMTNVIKLVKNIKINNKPEGWVVREIYNEEKQRTVMMDFGIYVSEDRFISVPIAYSIKNKLLPMGRSYDDGYKYYSVPADMSFGVSSFVAKNKMTLPLLVEPSEKYPAVLVSCLAYASPVGEKILSVKFSREDTLSLRDYIPKTRENTALILINSSTGVINPQIDVEMTTGFVGSNQYNSLKFSFENSTYHSSEEAFTTEETVNTSFIKLPRYQVAKTEKSDDKNENSNYKRPTRQKNFNRKRINYNNDVINFNRGRGGRPRVNGASNRPVSNTSYKTDFSEKTEL